jgi:hypothetical protein
MRLMLVPMMLTLLALTGCATGPFDAPPTAQFSEVLDVQVPWFGCPVDQATGLVDPNCVPSDPVIFPLSIYVTDSDTELPVNNIRVTFTSLWNDIYVMPQSIIEAVVIPDTESWSTLQSGGEVFAEFSGDYEGDYKPTFHDTWTDSAGRARTWVFVETMPVNVTGQPSEASILVDMGVETLFVKLTPAAG